MKVSMASEREALRGLDQIACLKLTIRRLWIVENWVRAGVNVYTPKTLSVVNATERAPELQARELGLSATYYLLNPRAIDWGLVGGAVRNGCELSCVLLSVSYRLVTESTYSM